MKKWFMLALCLAALAVSVSARSSAELQKELDRLQQQAQALDKESAALEEQLRDNEAQTSTTIERKSAIDQRIHMTEQELDNASEQIAQYSLLIAQKQSELEEAEEAHRQLNETYKARLRAMEEAGKISYWSVLFKSKSFSDLLDRIAMIHEIAAADERMLDELKTSAEQLALERAELEDALAGQQKAKTELAALEAVLLEQRAEADILLQELMQEEATLSEEYLAMLEQEEALREDLLAAQAAYDAARSAEQAALLAQQNQNNAAGSGAVNVTASTSGFTSPLPSGTWITSAFGPRKHPLYGYDGYHTGVDLAAGMGTAICAVAAGTVTIATRQDAWGYYVSISHGNGYGSMYAHMTNYIVSPGDTVSQGQVIGYVGSTGWSSGPHLHFELYINGAPVNPAGYISF